MKFQSVKGMDDILPGAIESWQALEQKTHRFLEAYGFREIRTPILESTELFSRSIGEASDIVHKEMYTFQDRGSRSLTLRPEMTASVVRSVIEHRLIKTGEPLYLYYMGAMFRSERPQAGRKRQFHQIGVETLNTHSIENDAELMILACSYFTMLGLKRFHMRINNLGTEQDRERYVRELSEYFHQHETSLCDDCKFRLVKNVLRIFDCKELSCKPAIDKAPKVKLSADVQKDYDKLQSLLLSANVPFAHDSKLVRGLDYYTGTVFEITAEGLGAQDAVLAGGRYDGLIQSLGGPKTGASGFALGVERLLIALEASGARLQDEANQHAVYVAALVHSESSCGYYRSIANVLYAAEMRAHFSFHGNSVGQHLGKASKMGAQFSIIVGEDELKRNHVTLKNMKSGKQMTVPVAQLRKAFGELC